METTWNVLIVAVTAVVLVLTVLMFVIVNPWLLFGVPAVLWAIAGVVRAIAGPRDRDDVGDDDPGAGNGSEVTVPGQEG